MAAPDNLAASKRQYVSLEGCLFFTMGGSVLGIMHKPNPERKYPGGTVDGINADTKEVGAVEKWVREKDVEPRRILNPEWDEREELSFIPGRKDVARKESRTDGPEWNPRRRRRGGEKIANENAISYFCLVVVVFMVAANAR
ncbi:hypothetical protein NDU88_003344 [Pleurodeles waltl]|uniref:Uncharacterized protein n=1 Tax=Pleurodeles waltl TaxID=8319 RepID=A0AAV7TNR7_PLEWA|nr:hypothetical protein NDU88_003344 [Pleurodeles waltl]